MKPKNLFLSIEGVDGVGKTTVAKLLAADGSFQYYKSPGAPFQALRKEIDAHATTLERYCFYCVSNQSDARCIKELLKVNSVVCDRYVASTMAYHFAEDDRIRAIHNDSELLKPDFVFLLGARTEIRDQRMFGRAKMSKAESNSDFLNRVAEIFMSLGLIYIDTSDITAQEVAARIRYVISQ